jgi:hypothetical protein
MLEVELAVVENAPPHASCHGEVQVNTSLTQTLERGCQKIVEVRFQVADTIKRPNT